MRGLVAVVVALAVAGAAAADSGEHVIQGDKSAGGIRIGRSTPSQVQALFGAPSTVRRPRRQSCMESWKGAKLTWSSSRSRTSRASRASP